MKFLTVKFEIMLCKNVLSFYNGREKFKIKLIRTTKTIQGLDKLILVDIN